MKSKRTYIIAEAGVNHNGNFELAKQLVDTAAEAGADCIKFQTFVPVNMVSKYAEKTNYQKRTTKTTESQLDMLQKLVLPFDDFYKLAEYASLRKIDFCSTAFDIESIQFVHQLKCKFWKIPSGEITNLPYLTEIAKFNEPIIMSTGMCDLEEIDNAVKIIRQVSNAQLILLHCNTEYPTPFQDVNLLAMNTLKQSFKCPVGYSDHTIGIEIPIAAVALGASIIEKHFTLNRDLPGPDHKASLEPEELGTMIHAIRNIEPALGTGNKIPQDSEKKNISIVRKSIVAKTKIKKGEKLTSYNITTKRPGIGISPLKWNELIGTEAVRDFEEDELIEM